MTDVLSPAAARRAFLLLTFARWFPVGLVVGIFTLWFLERGLTVSETLLAFSVTGIVVFVLELPTGGFADAFGRRPVLVAAAAVNIVAGRRADPGRTRSGCSWSARRSRASSGRSTPGRSRRGSSTPSTSPSPAPTSTRRWRPRAR